MQFISARFARSARVPRYALSPCPLLRVFSGHMRVSAKRVSGICGSLLALISLSRCSVLFLEALSNVRDERLQDAELLEICASGAARQSPKMRTACLQAQADRASPLVLKAVLRAVGMAYEDFASSVSTPGKLMVVVLFALSSLFLPVVSWLRAVLPADALADGTPHVVVLAGHAGETLGSPRLGMGSRLAEALRRRKPSLAKLEGPGFDLESDDSAVEIDWRPLPPHPKWE